VAKAPIDTTHLPTFSPIPVLVLAFEPVIDARCVSTVLAVLTEEEPLPEGEHIMRRFLGLAGVRIISIVNHFGST
jgi:hypothetical protein